MRKSGRTTKYPVETLEKAVQEYLTTDKGAKEVEAEYNIPEAVIRYHSKKEVKKRNEENRQQPNI